MSPEGAASLEPLDLALELIDVVTEGRDVSRYVRRRIDTHREVEAYRDAIALIEAANRDADSPHRALLVGDTDLELLLRVFRRDDALSTIYEADQRGATPDTGPISDQAAALVESVWDSRVASDELLEKAAKGWRVERMAPVDRSILRIAMWELVESSETPTPVIISEAVRLAKVYSTERSGSFVNGVLGQVASVVRPEA